METFFITTLDLNCYINNLNFWIGFDIAVLILTATVMLAALITMANDIIEVRTGVWICICNILIFCFTIQNMTSLNEKLSNPLLSYISDQTVNMPINTTNKNAVQHSNYSVKYQNNLNIELTRLPEPVPPPNKEQPTNKE